jgi:hypothetical protein
MPARYAVGAASRSQALSPTVLFVGVSWSQMSSSGTYDAVNM